MKLSFSCDFLGVLKFTYFSTYVRETCTKNCGRFKNKHFKICFSQKDNKLVSICEIIVCKRNLRVDEKLKYFIEKDILNLIYVFFNRELETLFCRFWIVWHSLVSL